MITPSPRFVASPAPGVPDHYLHKPPGLDAAALAQLPVLVMVHGISRNAAEQVLRAVQNGLAGLIIVAPLFERRAAGRYQLLGSGRSGVAADTALINLLDWLGHSGFDTEKVHLFGFSGGAQCAHRFALFHPQRVARLCLAAAGWYTLPDAQQAWPLGLLDAPHRCELPAVLSVPTLVIAGRGDTLRTASLNQTPAVDAAQGRHRLARALAWTQAMHAAGQRLGIAAQVHAVVVPANRHHFDTYTEAGELFVHLAAFLGVRPARNEPPRGGGKRRKQRLDSSPAVVKPPAIGGRPNAIPGGNLNMRTLIAAALPLLALSSLPGAAQAAIPELPSLRLERGGLDVRLSGVLSGQTALVEDSRRGPAQLRTGFDASVRINAEWVTESGLLFGAYVDQGRISRETEVLETGEAFAFISSDFGRVEVGLQDGGNEQVAFRAPIVGLGQVRGDFSRYAGTQALLVAPDTGDAFKIVYLSPPVEGFRASVSWAPKFQRNQRALDPADRTILYNAIEIGGSFQQPIGDWVLGASTGFVRARAAPETARQGLEAWNIGLDVRNGPLRIGGSFVDRGDSNRRTPGFNQREINAGIAWVTPEWGISGSVSGANASTERNRVFAVGGYYAVNRNIQLRADLARFVEHEIGRAARRGAVGLLELALLF